MCKGLKKYKTIAICVAKMHEEYENTLAMSIAREAKRRGYKALFFNSFSDLVCESMHNEGSASIYKLIDKNYIDLIAVLSETIKSDTVSKNIINYAYENNIPVVTVDRDLRICPNIEFEYEIAFEQIVRHVVEYHGCKTVNFIAGMENNEFSNVRVQCYKKVLEENNIPFDETRVGYGCFWAGPTKTVMETFLSDSRGLPEAIICANDVMAMTASQILQEHGFKIPEDIIVTGFDGIEDERYATPRLTTAETDFEELGAIVLNRLEEQLYKKTIESKKMVGFRVRHAQSCGCKAINPHESIKRITELHDRIAYIHGHENFMYQYLSGTIGCKSYRGLAKNAARYAEGLNIWMCLNRNYFQGRNYIKGKGLFDEHMVMLFHAKEDRLLEFCTEYKLEEYLPNMEQILDENDLLLFIPVHHLETVYGYAVIASNFDNLLVNTAHRYIMNTNQILESVHMRIELQIAYAEMKKMHLSDELTSLYNRYGFNEKNEELLEKTHAKSHEKIVVFSVDMDCLKEINDKYGHAMGDIAIRDAANILQEFTDDNAVCARLGGDEYALVMLTDDKDIKDLFEKHMKEHIEKYNNEHDYPFTLSMSFGMGISKEYSMDGIQEALRLADEEMYVQKRAKKNKTE